MDNKKTPLGIRLASMLIDHFILSFAILIILAPSLFFGLKNIINITHEQPVFQPEFAIYSMLFWFIVYFNKDIINGRSPAKRILKLQVIDIKTNKPASSIKCLIRNLTTPFWLLEVLITLFNPERRIGDLFAGTKVEVYTPNLEENKYSFKKSLSALILSLFIVSIFLIPLSTLTKSFNDKDIDYIEESYNDDLSNSLTAFLSYRFREVSDSIDIKCYNKINGDDLKYISILYFTKKESLFSDIELYNRFRKSLIDTLDIKIPKDSFVLNGKLIITTPQFTQVKQIYYDFRKTTKTKYGKDTEYVNDSTKIFRTFYNDGQLESEDTYINNKPFGTSKEWYENGNIRIKIEYNNGVRNGKTIEWYKNGQMKSELLYKDAYLIETINEWDKDGNVKQREE